MKRGVLTLMAAVLALGLGASTAAAQVVGTGTIEITVLDSSGSAIPGVLVTVEAVDINCPQHIPQMLYAEDVAAAIAPLKDRIEVLEAENECLRREQPPASGGPAS